MDLKRLRTIIIGFGVFLATFSFYVAISAEASEEAPSDYLHCRIWVLSEEFDNDSVPDLLVPVKTVSDDNPGTAAVTIVNKKPDDSTSETQADEKRKYRRKSMHVTLAVHENNPRKLSGKIKVIDQCVDEQVGPDAARRSANVAISPAPRPGEPSEKFQVLGHVNQNVEFPTLKFVCLAKRSDEIPQPSPTQVPTPTATASPTPTQVPTPSPSSAGVLERNPSHI